MEQTFFFCPECGELDIQETHVETRAQSGKVRGEEITVEMPLRVCNHCGEPISDTTLDDAMVIASYDEYRRRHNIIFPAQIVAIREKYSLSQKNLAILLGLGEVTVHRYETGALADEAPSKLLRLMDEPANMQRMLDESGDNIPQASRLKVQKRLDALAPKTTVTAKPRAAKTPAQLAELDAAFFALGFKSKELTALKRLVLPAEYAEAKAIDATGRAYIESEFSLALGLDLPSLRAPQPALQFLFAAQGNFKSRRDAPASKESIVSALGIRLAGLIAAATDGAKIESGAHTAASIRAEILATGVHWIGLRELLEWSWNHGLPIVKATLPEGLKRWEGMASAPPPHNQPVALSFCARSLSGWQSFIVAHELGHHFLGHVTPETPQLDIAEGETDKAQTDAKKQREIEANEFALQLLTGGVEVYLPDTQWKTGVQLAEKIAPFAMRNKIHPAVVALQLMRYGVATTGSCMDAAKILDPDDSAAVFNLFYSRLKREMWSETEAGFIERFLSPQK